MSVSKPGFQIQIRYVLLPLLIAVIVFAIYLMNYLGTFKPVLIEEKKAGPFLTISQNHVGAYHKIVPKIQAVETWAKGAGFDCKLSFGEYDDNPQTTEEARLRSRGGCFVDHFPDTLPEGFEKKTVPERNYVVAIFEGSPGIGPMKVYPKVNEYIESQRLSRDGETVIEVYEVHSPESMTTTYYFPIQEKK